MQNKSRRNSVKWLKTSVGQTYRWDAAGENHDFPDQARPHSDLLGSEPVRCLRAFQRCCGPHHHVDLGGRWTAICRERYLGGVGLDMPADDPCRAQGSGASLRD